MKGSTPRRPSPALIVALLALVVALSGTAIAATSLVNGDKLIKKQSLSGNRLRNHTLTGKQIKLSALGKVPDASHADAADNATNATTAADATHATAADNATTANSANIADTAISADTAVSADTLAGLPPSTFQHSCQEGAIGAHAYVKGSVSFPSTYTHANPPIQDQFNCTGGIVEVKRTAVGTYDVHFAGLDSGAQLIATGTQTVDPLGVQVNGGEVTYKLIFDAAVSGTVYQVKLFNTNGSAVDNEFSFALLSTQ